MPARLTLHPDLRPPLRWAVFEDRSYLLGRDAGCDLVVEDERVSRQHARLAFAEGSWRIADLDSKNGLAVGGLAAREARLEPGCWLSLGGVVGRFESLDGESARREAESRAARWRSSAELARRLDPGAGLDGLLRQVLGSVLELSGGERGFVLLAGAGGLEVVAASGLGAEELVRPEFAGSVGAVQRALAERRPVAIADLATDDSLGARPSVLAGGIRALACVPLVSLGRPLGALYTDSRQPGACFEALDVELLEAFADHAALALAVARLDRDLAELAASLPALSELPEPLRGRLERALAATRPPAVTDALPADRPPTLSSWVEVVAAHAGSSA
jgi:hypothetical protein